MQKRIDQNKKPELTVTVACAIARYIERTQHVFPLCTARRNRPQRARKVFYPVRKDASGDHAFISAALN